MKQTSDSIRVMGGRIRVSNVEPARAVHGTIALLSAAILHSVTACAPGRAARQALPSEDVSSEFWSGPDSSTLDESRIKNAEPLCLADRGCGFIPAAAKPCRRGISAVPYNTVRGHPSEYLGKTTTILGQLKPTDGMLETRACQGCCATRVSALGLGDTTGTTSAGIALSGEPYRCRGDHTAMCCGIETGISVVARGRLRDDGDILMLDDAVLCLASPDP